MVKISSTTHYPFKLINYKKFELKIKRFDLYYKAYLIKNRMMIGFIKQSKI